MSLPSAPTRKHLQPRRASRSRRSGGVALATAAALALALLSAPPGAASPATGAGAVDGPGASGTTTLRSQETPGGSVVTGGGIVTLVTGDRVRVTTYSDGTNTAAILPGSPHFGRAVNIVDTPDGSYVIPRLPVRERMKLDTSLFNVSALLRQPGDEVAMTVTFAEEVVPHAVPGLVLDRSSTHRTPDGSTVVAAHYSASSSGATAAPGALRGVALVTLPTGRPAAAPAGYRMHTLTVHVVNRQGNPVRFEQAWVQNVDDAALFTQPFYILQGVGKVSVPAGNYAVFAGNFASLLIEPDFAVDADTSLAMSLSDATVKPSESVVGYRPTDTSFGAVRSSEKHGSFSALFVSDRYGVRVQPVPASLPHGDVRSAVGGTLARADEFSGGFPPAIPSTLAYTKDARAGIPHAMAFAHGKEDFAIVPQRFHANNPAGTRFTYVTSLAAFEFFVFAFGYQVRVPSVRTVWLQGSSALTWIQDFDATKPSGRDFKLASLTKQSRYTPGTARPVSFAHGPVGPGLEAAYDNNVSGPTCVLCRDGLLLHGYIPLFSGAGTAMSGLLWNPEMGSWSLRRGFTTLASGHFGIAPSVRLPAGSQTYTLSASSHPGVPAWQLSTRVSDAWTFTSGAAKAAIPLLMASYVPRTALNGSLPPGRTTFPLDFGNLGPTDATVTHARVQYSTDGGRTWRDATVTRVDKNSFGVTYTNPAASGTAAYASLRVTGVDAAGRSVTETAINAYRLVTAGDASSTESELGPQVPGLGTRACSRATEDLSSCYAVVVGDGDGGLLAGGEPAGLGATDIRDAYDIPDLHSHQTVAVVVAYDYPTAEEDLATYRRHYGLPPCTAASGCFTKINQRGQPGSYPDADPGWSIEAALDLQMISAACPTCHIILAEADQPTDKDLAATTNAAVAAGAVVTNHSYGIGEHTGIRYVNAAYNHPGVTAVAASGDSGFGAASFPASSSSVISVGGTVLHHADNPRGWRENAWRYGGSGCSAYFAKRDYQHDPACGMRTYADMSAVAFGVAVYNSYAFGPRNAWLVVAGTSISSPLVAGLVGAARAGGVKPGSLYGTPGSFHDVRLGSNGICRGSYMCTAKPGFDAPTGWGTPRGLAPFSVG